MPKKYGNQKPRIEVVPKYEYTDGQDASELVKAYGYELDPWQNTVINAWLGRNSQDKFTSKSCGLAVPRQNGKNALLEVRELYGMVCMGEHILHTAHEVKTARKAFNRLAAFFENEREYPELAAMVASIRKTNGQEAIEVWKLDPDTLEPMVGTQGGSVEFSARSRGAARGFTVDTVVFDEAQELTDEQLDALLPTLRAAPSGDRQFIYTGTPPTPNSPGEVFERIRSSAIAGKDESLAWHEWSVEKMPPKDATQDDLLNLLYETNPAIGYRIDADFIKKETITMSADGFARECLGFWQPHGRASAAIPASLWEQTSIEGITSKYNRKRCFSVKFTYDGTHYVLAGSMSNGRGKYATEIIDIGSTAKGIAELAQWLKDRKQTAACVAIDGIGAADALCKELEDAPRGYVRRVRSYDLIAASASFIDLLASGKCVHTKQDETDECAKRCPKRAIGARGGWSFGRDGDLDAAPLEALSLAVWAARSTKRNPRRVQRLQ